MRRSDIIVSLCIDDWTPSENNTQALSDLSTKISEKFRYWEVVVAVNRSDVKKSKSTSEQVRNLRILGLNGDRNSSYKRREVVALQAIGDVVVMSSMEEVEAIDLEWIIEKAEAGFCVIGLQSRRNSIINPLIRTLGLAAGFLVDARAFRTVAMPKNLLDLMLQQASLAIALRFPPASNAVPIAVMPSPLAARKRVRMIKGIGQKIFLVEGLLTSAAPMVLQFVTYLSIFVFASAILFTFYAIVVYLFKDTAEGWLTTSLAISGTSAFLAVAIIGICTGLKRMIDLLAPTYSEPLPQEFSSLELFNDVLRQLNVDSASSMSVDHKESYEKSEK